MEKNSQDLLKDFLTPGILDASDNLIDNFRYGTDGTTDIIDEVKSICTTVWTTSIKNDWKTKLIADKVGVGTDKSDIIRKH